MRSDRWATPEEIKATLSSESSGGMSLRSNVCTTPSLRKTFSPPAKTGGPVLYHNRGRIWHYGGEGHTMYLGTSGSGKSRRGTLPLIRTFLKGGESYCAVDPKGELHRATVPFAVAEGYEVITIDFRRIFESARFNPLAAPYELFKTGDPVKKQLAMEMVDELAYTLYPVHDKADPFWPESARSLFVAAVYALFEYADADQVNMASVYQLVAKGEGRMGPSNYLKSFVDILPSDSIASMLLQSYVNTASDTKAGIRSTFLEGLSMFARSEGLIEMLSGDDLHINSLRGDRKTAIYIIIPDETPIFDKLCGVLCSQLMSHYIRVAEDTHGGRLPVRHNFVIEELGNVGSALRNLPHMLSAGRSRNVRVQYVLQSLSQLNNIYSSADATTIISNTDVVIAYRTNNWDTLSELSRMCGEREVDRGNHVSREPLITPSQLGAMTTGQALVTVSGSLRFITWLPDYEEMFDCSNWHAPERHIRSTHSKTSIFDIAKFVNEARKKKLLEASEEASTRTSSDTTTSMSSSVDSLIAKIDKRIRELEEEEKAEEQKQREAEQQVAMKPTSGESTFKYEVLVVSVGGSSKPWVVKAVSTACKISVVDAMRKLESLPASLQFKTKKEAVAAKKAISDAGGIALIQEHK